MITDSGSIVGILKDVLWLPSSDVYVVKNGNDEYLIPIIPEVVKGVDHNQGIIVIVPMDGLLD